MKKTVTFSSQCWEQDWEQIIKNKNFLNKTNNINHNFDKKNLFITNVSNKEIVKPHVETLISEKIIDNYFFCEDYENDVLNYFSINKETFLNGFWYSIGPLTSIYNCNTEYLVYQTGDCLTEKTDYDWIGEGISLMESNNKIKVVSPVWNQQYGSAKEEEKQHKNIFGILPQKNDNWTFNCGFSDQCFLIKVDHFKNKIYNEEHYFAKMCYPSYAGNSFEQRVGSHLMNNLFYRAISKKVSYSHPRYS